MVQLFRLAGCAYRPLLFTKGRQYRQVISYNICMLYKPVYLSKVGRWWGYSVRLLAFLLQRHQPWSVDTQSLHLLPFLPHFLLLIIISAHSLLILFRKSFNSQWFFPQIHNHLYFPFCPNHPSSCTQGSSCSSLEGVACIGFMYFVVRSSKNSEV